MKGAFVGKDLRTVHMILRCSKSVTRQKLKDFLCTFFDIDL